MLSICIVSETVIIVSRAVPVPYFISTSIRVGRVIIGIFMIIFDLVFFLCTFLASTLRCTVWCFHPYGNYVFTTGITFSNCHVF